MTVNCAEIFTGRVHQLRCHHQWVLRSIASFTPLSTFWHPVISKSTPTKRTTGKFARAHEAGGHPALQADLRSRLIQDILLLS